MKKSITCILLFMPLFIMAQKSSIYHDGWIDFNKNGTMDVYENPDARVEDRVDDLLSQMNLEEKTCQMTTLYGSGRVLKDALPTPDWKNEIWKDGIGNIDEEHNGLGKFGSEYSFPFSKHVEALHIIQRWFVENTRLGIPVDFTNEGIRGLCHDRATYFPAQSGQGCTWDKDLIARIGDVEGEEAVVLGYTNIYSPILGCARDPRWGRVVESYGEDPYLVSQLGKQMIISLQKHGLVSTVKHFAVYSVPVGGRDGETRTDPQIPLREMETLLLEPFRVAFQEAGALGTMSSYNDYDGVPVTGSYYFLTEILRQQYGFKGYVVSDSRAVRFIYSKHRVADSYENAVVDAVNAGLNIRTDFTQPQDYILPLRKAVEEGKISEKTIDNRVSDILRVKFYLGLFDDPYKGDARLAEKTVHSKAHQQVALQAARESIVLLKNESDLLPLSKSLKAIAVIGPNADERKDLISRYGPANAPLITVYQGIKDALSNAHVVYKKGCELTDKHFPESQILPFPMDSVEKAMIEDAVDAAQKSDAVVLVLGGSEKTIGESRSRTSLDLTGRQEDLLRAVYATGKPVVLILMNGGATTINDAQKNIPGIIYAPFPGEFSGKAIAEVLFGDYNPGGKLSVTFPKTVGQIPYAFPFKPGSDAEARTSIWGPLYPFGFGLSYTRFAFSDLHISPEKQGPKGTVNVTCKVKNTGSRKGDEVVQLYIHDEYSSVTAYTSVLRGFERITLEPGEEKEVSFTLNHHDLGLWDRNNRFKVEPGKFEVMVGNSSKDIRLKGEFQIVKPQ